MYNTESEFSVKINHKKVTLSKKGILSLAVECFACAYDEQKTSTTLFFRVESDAMEFVQILDLHSVES